jgi:hypothetical protein
MRRWTGRWLMVVAVLHTAFGLVVFRAQWAQLFDSARACCCSHSWASC